MGYQVSHEQSNLEQHYKDLETETVIETRAHRSRPGPVPQTLATEIDLKP